jgi:hypothetical protein
MMADSTFVGYVGAPDFHDGSIRSIEEHRDSVCVHVRGASGKLFRVDFNGVGSVISNRPAGMRLYALVESSVSPPFRRFIFANWDDESEAQLTIDALDCIVTVQ